MHSQRTEVVYEDGTKETFGANDNVIVSTGRR